MARYLSQHTLACLTRQGAEQLAKQLHASGAATTGRVLVNMVDGKMLVEFDAADRDAAEKRLASMRFHSDWLLRIEFEWGGGEGMPLLGGAGASSVLPPHPIP